MLSNSLLQTESVSATDTFLNEVRTGSPFLKSRWGADVLIADFGSYGKYELDLSRGAFSGTFKTTEAYESVKSDIYDFVCVHAHRAARFKRPRSMEAHKKHFVAALYIVDYLLLNASRLGIYESGFQGISGMRLKQLLAARASHSEAMVGLLQWPARLTKFLINQGAMLTEAEVERCLSECSALTVLDVPENERILGLTSEELIRARCWLWVNGHYTSRDKIDYVHVVNNNKLAKQVFAGTLWVSREEVSKPVFDELCVLPTERHYREFPGAPVRSMALDDACSERAYAKFKRVLTTAKLLSQVQHGFPLESIQEAESFALSDAIRLKPEGRYVSVPPEFALDVCGKAISFFLEHSHHLLLSYANIVSSAKAANSSISDFIETNGIRNYLHPKTRKMGVTCWSIAEEINIERLYNGPKTRVPAHVFFRRLRENDGLRELIQVLYGAMQLIVGVLMAARQGELIDLPLDCLDESREWLTLMSRKTGFQGLRHEDERPVPYIASRVVLRINAFHRLLRLNGLETPNLLFSLPNIKGTFSVSTRQYNGALDRFIDYIDAPPNFKGERYYLRQHQLRRLFALLFYLSPYYGSLDDLRWMLRHIDSEHLEHYITHAFPGEQLVVIRAEAFAMSLRKGNEELADLRAFVDKHFGAKRIDLMTEEGFEDYVRYLKKSQLDGSVVVEPVMFPTADGVHHKFALTVFED